MGKSIYTREQKKLAYEMYWEERENDLQSGKKSGKYSLSEIAEVTGMKRDYISKIARGENTLTVNWSHVHHVQETLCDKCWRKDRCLQGKYRCRDYHDEIFKIGRLMQ